MHLLDGEILSLALLFAEWLLAGYSVLQRHMLPVVVMPPCFPHCSFGSTGARDNPPSTVDLFSCINRILLETLTQKKRRKEICCVSPFLRQFSRGGTVWSGTVPWQASTPYHVSDHETLLQKSETKRNSSTKKEKKTHN